MSHLLGEVAPALGLWNMLSCALLSPIKCPQPFVGLEGCCVVPFFRVAFWLCAFGFWYVWLWCLPVQRAFLESKLWEDGKYIWGIKVVVIDFLTSSQPHQGHHSWAPVSSPSLLLRQSWHWMLLCSDWQINGPAIQSWLVLKELLWRVSLLLRKTPREGYHFSSAHCCVCMWCLELLQLSCYQPENEVCMFQATESSSSGDHTLWTFNGIYLFV